MTQALFVPLLVSALLAGPAPSAPVRLSKAEVESLLKEMSASVEQLRGLKFKTPVTMQVIDGAAARADFKSKIEPREEEQVRHVQQAYIHLGLIPRGTDLLSRYLDLAEKDVAGYYAPGSKTFFLLDHIAPAEVRPVMAHELTHALEDQHYDLKAVSQRAAGDDDASTALTSVIEGSAMVVMMAYLIREHEKGRTAYEDVRQGEARRAKRLKTAPSFTQRSVMMPYLLGPTFLLRGNPWNWIGPGGGVRIADLDKAYANPPRSTRQVLHPDQYWQNPDKKWEPLTLSDLSSILGRGWTKATAGSIGELGLSVLTGARVDFEQPEVILSNRWTNDAAAGTTGDLFHHYVNGDRSVTVLVTRWETTQDAEEFDRALAAKGKIAFRYGVNFIVLAGDYGDAGEALASAALQGASYWPK
jgi:hypothetical protein